MVSDYTKNNYSFIRTFAKVRIDNFKSPGLRVPLLKKFLVKGREIAGETVVAATEIRRGLATEAFVFIVMVFNVSRSFQMKDLIFKVLERFVAQLEVVRVLVRMPSQVEPSDDFLSLAIQKLPGFS